MKPLDLQQTLAASELLRLRRELAKNQQELSPTKRPGESLPTLVKQYEEHFGQPAPMYLAMYDPSYASERMEIALLAGSPLPTSENSFRSGHDVILKDGNRIKTSASPAMFEDKTGQYPTMEEVMRVDPKMFDEQGSRSLAPTGHMQKSSPKPEASTQPESQDSLRLIEKAMQQPEPPTAEVQAKRLRLLKALSKR